MSTRGLRLRLLACTAAASAILMTSPGTAIPPGSAQPHLAWSPGNPEPGQDVTFSISAHDPDGVIVSAVVEYGDGTKDTIVAQRSLTKDLAACVFGDYFVGTLRHRYAATGYYPVKLVVTSGACPLAEALQETRSIISHTLKVAKAGAAAPPGVADDSAAP